MADASNKRPTKNASEASNSLTWYGVQYINRARGTQEIIQRSFPFWVPTIKFAIDHAKQTNKAPKHQRTFWTHLIVHAKLIETSEGAKKEAAEIEEIKV